MAIAGETPQRSRQATQRLARGQGTAPTPPHPVTHLRDNLMGCGSRGKAAGRTPEFPTQVPQVPTGLGGRRGCWSRRGQQHANLSQPSGDRQSPAGCYLPWSALVPFAGTALEWFLPLALGGSTVSRAQRFKLVPGPQSAGLIPCGQVLERPVLGAFTTPSSLSPVSSICSLILCPHAPGACSFHEHAFPATRLPSALEQRSQGDRPSGQSQQGRWRGESQTGETLD